MKKIEELIKDSNLLEKHKVLSEIKLLKVQRLIAVLTLAGGILSFLILNAGNIRNLFDRVPQIRFVFEDRVISKGYSIRIVDDDEKLKRVVKYDDARKTISLEKGQYYYQLLIDDDKVFEDSFFADGDRDVIIPKNDTGRINVSAKLHTDVILPKTELRLTINSNGNGYIWCFGYDPNVHGYELIYPVTGNIDNYISVDQSYEFPDSNHISLFSGEAKGEEKILFVVTSGKDGNLAREIAAKVGDTAIVKAYSDPSRPIWGYSELTYEIR
jgi:hypothetical protein